MLSWFEFAGMSTATIPGLVIEGKRTYDLPERDVERIIVPGRSGEVLIDHGSYRNVTVSYQVAVTDYDALPALRHMLTVGRQTGASHQPWRGYQLLRDSYDTWERLAVCSMRIFMDEIVAKRLLRFNVTFDCKPQRYFNRAAVTASFKTTTAAVVTFHIDRPAGATAAAPRIEVIGAASASQVLGVNFDGQQLDFSPVQRPPAGAAWPSITIDSEAMVAFQTNTQGIRTNRNITPWPTLWRPRTAITISGGSARTDIRVYPRWYAI